MLTFTVASWAQIANSVTPFADGRSRIKISRITTIAFR